ncbi:MAG: hypothetical protein PHF97_06850 [Bacteroidales bacterium]|nr:hypothetical protein [Bacteroidales bacterium]MDD4603508.1 hypothetical protein [Bacteroidales bacterium]
MTMLKQLIHVLILGMLILPYLQKSFIFIPPTELKGVADTIPVPGIPWKTWNSEEVRSKYTKTVGDNIGFRSYFIKLKNQVDFSLFTMSYAPDVVIGKNDNLFLEPYINNYIGRTFKGPEKIDYEISHLEKIQSILKQKNIDFLLIFAPGKATVYSEDIPNHYKKRSISNYDYYIKRIDRSHLNFIDMNAWFKKIRNNTPYPLYPRSGVHWTSYGVGLAADSMFRYIEKLCNIDLPEFGWKSVVVSDSLRYSDNDACELMNLFYPPHYDPMPYPKFYYSTTGKTRPNVMTIGDSYWWGFAATGITENVFSKDNFWFYNKVIFENGKKVNRVRDVSLKGEIDKQNLVIMMVTEATYELFPYGFIEDFFTRYLSYQEADNQILLELKIEEIKKSPDWYQSIVQKAKNNHVSVEDQLKQDAQYMIDLKNSK